VRQYVGRGRTEHLDGFADRFEVRGRALRGELARTVAARIRARGFVVVPEKGVLGHGLPLETYAVPMMPESALWRPAVR
jgi:hypothetical protein